MLRNLGHKTFDRKQKTRDRNQKTMGLVQKTDGLGLCQNRSWEEINDGGEDGAGGVPEEAEQNQGTGARGK